MEKRDLSFEVERVTTVAARLQNVIEENKQKAVRSDIVDAVTRFFGAREKLRHVSIKYEGFLDWYKHKEEQMGVEVWDGVKDTANSVQLKVVKDATGRRPRKDPKSRVDALLHRPGGGSAMGGGRRGSRASAASVRSRASRASRASRSSRASVAPNGMVVPRRASVTGSVVRSRRGSNASAASYGTAMSAMSLRDEEAWSGAVRLGNAGRGFIAGCMELPKHGTWTIRITVTKPNPLEVNRSPTDVSGGNSHDNVTVMLGSSATSLSTVARVFNVRAPGRADAVHLLSYVRRPLCSRGRAHTPTPTPTPTPTQHALP